MIFALFFSAIFWFNMLVFFPVATFYLVVCTSVVVLFFEIIRLVKLQ